MHQRIPLLSVRHPWRLTAAALAALTLALAACHEPEAEEPVEAPSLQEIVAYQALFLMRAQFTPLAADTRAELLRFYEAHEPTAEGRLMLAGQWQGHGELYAAFRMEEDVFQVAEQDGDWADRAREAGFDPDAVDDAVFEAGFWSALETFLEENP